MKTLAAYTKRYEYKGDLNGALEQVGGNSDHERWSQPAFMMISGLRPNHSFLDLGCGCLRGTAKLVDYLNEGNFYGADVSSGFIENGFIHLDSIQAKNTPKLFVIEDFNLCSLMDKKFDFILSISLLTHILPETLPDLFTGVKDVLAKNGIWYFSIYPTDAFDHTGDIELMFYRKSFLIELGKKHGLKIEDIPGDFPNPCENFIGRVNVPLIGQWMMKAVLA